MTEAPHIDKHSNQLSAFASLTKRHLKVFFKNIPTVIFTMMVPFTIFAVYLLFLRNIQVDQIKNYYQGFDSLSPDLQSSISALADSWMVSGVLGVSCITVSLNCQYIMVKDKENQLSRDMVSSPINPNVIMASYFTFNVIVAFIINLIVFAASMIVLLVFNSFVLPFTNFIALIGVLFFSAILASLFSFLVASFVNTEAVMSPLIAICCAAIGFLVGAYLPNSMMPEYINNLTAFIPGTYSVGLFRHFLMANQVESIKAQIPAADWAAFISGLGEQFNIHESAGGSIYVAVSFFDNEVNPAYMVFAIFVSIVIFLVADSITLHFKKFAAWNSGVWNKAKNKITSKNDKNK